MRAFLRSNVMWGAVIPAAVALAQMPGIRPAPPVPEEPKHGMAYRYQAGNKTDPFLPMAFETAEASGAGTSKLQQFEVKDYHLVGTLVGSEISALLLTPDKGDGLIAKVGERMGRRGGRIISIAREKMVVREPRPRGPRGDGPRSEDITLELRDPDASTAAAKSLSEGAENASLLETLQLPGVAPGARVATDAFNAVPDAQKTPQPRPLSVDMATQDPAVLKPKPIDRPFPPMSGNGTPAPGGLPK